jgi:CRP-like cAMP-binding protein
MKAMGRPVTQSVPAFRRLAALATLDLQSDRLLAEAAMHSRSLQPGRELLTEGAPVPGPTLILSGWAARARLLADGRRQIMSLILPGDLIGNCRQNLPLAVSSVVALSHLTLCAAPARTEALKQAHAVSHALDEAYLLAQITRLGRLSAEERLIDLMLEVRDRLALCGLVTDNAFAWPLTQSALADVLGLTPVHVNRTLQQLRGSGDVILRAGRVQLMDPSGLATRVGHVTARVTSDTEAARHDR